MWVIDTISNNPVATAMVAFAAIWFAQNYFYSRKQKQNTDTPSDAPQTNMVIAPQPKPQPTLEQPPEITEIQNWIAYRTDPAYDLRSFISMAYHDACTMPANKRNEINELLDKMREALPAIEDKQETEQKLLEGQTVTLSAEQAEKLNQAS